MSICADLLYVLGAKLDAEYEGLCRKVDCIFNVEGSTFGGVEI